MAGYDTRRPAEYHEYEVGTHCRLSVDELGRLIDSSLNMNYHDNLVVVSGPYQVMEDIDN